MNLEQILEQAGTARPGYELASFKEAGLPVYLLTVRVLTLEKKPLTLQSIECHEHPGLLKKALNSSQKRLLIISPWITSAVVDYGFISSLEALLRRRVDVFIGYGLDDGDDGRGNPPFGHAGESAIQEWFESSKLFLASQMSETEKSGLLKFEGNAQGLRTLWTLQNYPQPGGLQLTSAVLGTFTKYPRASHVDITQRQGISAKKFGFMQSEAVLFEELATELGLVKKPGDALAWHRHPLAFLVEAADDICYHVMDVEDGFKAGVISLEEIENLHRPWLSEKQLTQGSQINHTQRRAEYFRAVTVNAMILEAVDVFKSNYDEIMSGGFDEELAARMQHSNELAAFKELAKKKVYCTRPVIEVEACGFEVIGGLLDAFVGAIETKVNSSPIGKTRSRTLLNLLPVGVELTVTLTPYQRMMVATDFVSGMTDSFAVELYQRIRGIALP